MGAVGFGLATWGGVSLLPSCPTLQKVGESQLFMLKLLVRSQVQLNGVARPGDILRNATGGSESTMGGGKKLEGPGSQLSCGLRSVSGLGQGTGL